MNYFISYLKTNELNKKHKFQLKNSMIKNSISCEVEPSIDLTLF